ncbi:MAG TPA: DNA polymerase III subunit gamma/tau [Gemmatimonadales bacterium]|nr:DNA polymerase III subunit gamma/tau [Gemmatimonadales bacterium]
MSLALARRYRPRRFAELLVQDHVATALRGAVAKERVGHGYLLTGPRGVGKTTAARILAMALNCAERTPEGEPCGECDACLRIWNGQANLDVIEIDAASNRGVDDARDLRERAMYAASEAGHHKVYIVDEAHMLTREAWNALLKILEEPPPGVVFVFATTEPQKIANAAAPVMSRLQRFDFRRIGPVAIQSRLRDVLAREGVDAEDDALLLIGRHADGGMRDALSVLDQCLSFGEGALTAARVREVLGLIDEESFGELLALVAERQPGRVFPTVDTLVDAGADLVEVAGGLAELLRAIIMHHYGAVPTAMGEGSRRVVATASAGIGPEDAVRMLKLLGEAETNLRRSANPRLVLETLLLRWAMMDRAVDLRALLSGGATEPAAAPSPVVPSPPPPTPSPAPAETTASAPAYSVPWDDTALRAAWPDILAAASRHSPFLGKALQQADPRVGDPGVLELAFGPDQAVSVEGVERQKATVATLASARLGTEVRIEVVTPTHPGRENAAPVAARRLTADTIREDRLQELRRIDPALDAMADALDLELVDER